jgi:hypothetical protein
MRKFIDIVAAQVAPTPVSKGETVLSLLEAAKAYEQMMDSTITFLEKLGEVCEYDKGDYIMVAHKIKTSAKELGNGRNLATWFTRWARAGLIAALGKYFEARTRDSQQFGDGSFGNSEAMETLSRYVGKVVQDYERQTDGKLQSYFLGDLEREITGLVDKLKHLKTVDFQPIQTYVFTNQTPNSAMEELEALEQRFSERKNTQRHLAPREDDKIVLKVGDDFAWWLLPRKSCTDEKNAMSHCGNTASPREGQQILSLREHVEGNKWIPHATFIWNADGTLGERKGYANHQLKPAFFKYVIPLLKQPWIKGLVGGAHWSHNDFSISWLPEDQQRELLDANPNLASIGDRYRLYGLTDDLMHQINNGVEKVGQDWYRLNSFALSEMSDEDRRKLYSKYPHLMSLEEQYKTYGMTQDFANQIAAGVAREGNGFYYSNKFNPRTDMPQEDLFKLFDFHPELMTYQERLRRFGMNDELMDLVRADIVGQHTTVAARDFINHCGHENREKLFAKYPETMLPHEYYQRLGMTPVFKELVNNGLKVDGTKWFVGNAIAPSVDFRGMFEPWEIRQMVAPDSVWAILTREDTEKLFDGEDDLLLKLFPHAHYQKHGMTDALVDHLKEKTADGLLAIKREHFPIDQIEPEHRDHLIDHIPSFETPQDYYRRRGLDDNFQKWLRDKEMLGTGDPMAHTTLDFRAVGLDFAMRHELSKEDLETMFKKFPELMFLGEHYERRGMDKLFIDTIAEGWANYKREFFFNEEFDPNTDLSPEDRVKLFKKLPHVFPFKDQMALKPEAFFENVKAYCGNLYDAPFGDSDLELTEDGKIVVTHFKDVNELINELGGDEIKHYSGEDFYANGHFESDVSHMKYVLPYALRMKIGQYAAAEYSVEPDDDDEDQVEAETIDPRRWSEVIDALEENNDPLHDALETASEEGSRFGWEADVHKEVVKSVKNIETVLGTINFNTLTDDEGEEQLSWDGPITWTFSFDEMATFLDSHTDRNGYCDYDSWSSLIEHGEIRMRQSDFSGFDAEAALDRFLDEADEDVYEGAPENPYRSVVQGRRVWKEVSRKEMIAEIEKLYGEMGENFSGYLFNYKRRAAKTATENEVNTIHDLTDEELTELFRSTTKKYYI